MTSPTDMVVVAHFCMAQIDQMLFFSTQTFVE